jgi:DNA-binding NtrC family response regulator
MLRPPTSAVPNIVIVDDENDILLTYKRYLSSQPVNIELFSDPVQLLGRLALVGPSYYDLAIIDIRMPKISGFQVYQILAALKPSIKALFVH